MEPNNSLIIDKALASDVNNFCELNDIADIEKFKRDCFRNGYNLIKYGLLGDDSELNLPVREVEVEKVVYVTDDAEIAQLKEKEKMITETLFNLRNQISDKDARINELEKQVADLSNIIKAKLATYYSTSNLKDKL